MENPVLVNVIRRDRVESTHRGSAVVVDGRDQIVFSVGNPERMIYPRSSLKYFQAIPLLESGAAARFNLSDKEIALACASHNAERFHADAVTAWLARLDLDQNALECGVSLPLNETAAHELIAAGEQPGRAHHNCSGKHTGMLTLARHLETEIKGYSDYHHPTQKAWMQVLGELIEADISGLHWERDGCGLPAICMPMQQLALAFARFANLDTIPGSRGQAMSSILGAITAHPEMIAGTGRCCTALIKHTSGKVMVKTGAEGVFAGCIPDRGLGFALKIDDGASRGSEVALGALLKKLDAIESDLDAPLAPWFRPEVRNSQDWVTGSIEPAEIWN